ncbi:MAG TPA: hypothetical protein VJ385_21890 [Fibrobacteria bacterium]|nr:hypothetical protein [Fibrobacteria bacterium]
MSSALAALALGTQGCYVYSAFQGARTLDTGRYSISPSASIVSFGDDGESSWITTQFGARGAVGLGNRLELQSRYERVEPHDDNNSNDWGYNYVDMGFKYGIVKDVLAVGMPVGFMFGEHVDEGESWQLHPSLFLTLPAARFLDVNLSTTGLYFLNDSEDNFLWAFNGGLGIRPSDGRFTLMPEMGILTNPGEGGHFWHWGVGASMEF